MNMMVHAATQKSTPKLEEIYYLFPARNTRFTAMAKPCLDSQALSIYHQNGT